MTKTEAAELQNHYKTMEQRLIGWTVPMELEIPVESEIEPPKEVMDMYNHLMNFLNSEHCPHVFAFMRQKADELDGKYHPSEATEHQLRYAKSYTLFPKSTVKAIIKFVAAVSAFQMNRAEWLAKQPKKPETPQQPVRPQNV